jgi:electron transfer flavoprotein alpha subunit
MAGTEILVFSEQPTLLRELLGEARRQADALGWRVGALPWGQAAAMVDWGEAGADVVYTASGIESDNQAEIVVAALAEAFRQVKPRLVLVGATKLGMESASRVAERLGLGYAPWTVSFAVSADTLAVTARCMLYIGIGLATYTFKPGSLILTSAANVFEPQPAPGRLAAVETLTVPTLVPCLTVIERKPKQVSGINLTDAKVVVDIGQGVRQKEDLKMVTELVSLLDGIMTCSRPVASDRDWFPEWVGLSGKKVAPELCLTVGVSGAVQHIVGIRDSRLIVAVNSDEGAPIFNQADYGVVTDLYEFVPAFIERLKARGVRLAWSLMKSPII